MNANDNAVCIHMHKERVRKISVLDIGVHLSIFNILDDIQ